MTSSITIDSSVLSTVPLASPTRHQVVVSETVIYQFFHDNSAADFCWQKSTDGGLTWGTINSVFGNGAGGQWHDIYYQRWNGASEPNIVHLAYAQDFGLRGLYYNTLNLDTDTLGTPVRVIALGAFTGARGHGLGVARDGTIRIDGHGFLFAVDGVYSTDGGVTWNGTGNTFGESDNDDYYTVWADFAGDVDDLIAIYWDVSAKAYSIKRWDKSAGTVTETAIGTVTDSAQFGSTINRSTGHISLAYLDIGAATRDIKTWDIYGATVTAKTNVVTAETFVGPLALAINSQGAIRCYYAQDDSLASFSSLEVYYKESTDGMATWGSRTAYGTNSTAIVRIVSDPVPTTAVAPAWQTSSVLYIEAAAQPWALTYSGTMAFTFPKFTMAFAGTWAGYPPGTRVVSREIDSNPSDAEGIDSNPSDTISLAGAP